jgi:hypothetical protein
MIYCSKRIGSDFGRRHSLEIWFTKLSKTSACLQEFTLENLAMSINLRSRRISSPIKLVTPLSGKHLQSYCDRMTLNGSKSSGVMLAPTSIKKSKLVGVRAA